MINHQKVSVGHSKAESDLQSHNFLPTKNKQVIVMNTVLTRFPPFLSFTLLLCDGVLNFLIFKRDKKLIDYPGEPEARF